MNINFTGKKNKTVKDLIKAILEIFVELQMPINSLTDRRRERMAMACLAVGNIKKTLREAESSEHGNFLTTRQIIAFENRWFGENISSGSYDDIRRRDLSIPVEAGIVMNSNTIERKATNNPTRGYALSPEFAELLKSYGTGTWDAELSKFKEMIKGKIDELNHARELDKLPVILPSGENIQLSFGEHNLLQKAVLEEFLPRFGMEAKVLYVGDTSDKFLYIDQQGLQDVGFFEIAHEELPDIIAYSKTRDILFMIEAVYSSGPMNEIRVHRLESKLSNCTAHKAFITAFLTIKDFKRWLAEIAWETEVWIADTPDHMVHFNGYKFLEIHK